MFFSPIQELFDAGEEKWGTDEEVFNRIFSINDFYTLNRVYTEYVKVKLTTRQSNAITVHLYN